jgi:hypothetical protein
VVTAGCAGESVQHSPQPEPVSCARPNQPQSFKIQHQPAPPNPNPTSRRHFSGLWQIQVPSHPHPRTIRRPDCRCPGGSLISINMQSAGVTRWTTAQRYNGFVAAITNRFDDEAKPPTPKAMRYHASQRCSLLRCGR